jgi:two-component system, NtrC family, sensor kinase
MLKRGSFRNRGYFLLFIFWLMPFLPLKAQTKNIDSIDVDLFSILEEVIDQEGMFYTPIFKRGGVLTGSKVINEKKLQSATKSGNYTLGSTAALNLAWIEMDAGNNEKAISYLIIAKDARTQLEDDPGEAVIEMLIAYVHYKTLNYESATKYVNAALIKLEKTNSKNTAAIAHAMLGQLYLVQKDNANAQKHFQLANKSFASLGNKRGEAKTGVQLAEIAVRKNDPRLAESHLKSALALFETIKDKNGQALVFRDKGIIKFKKGDYLNAITEYKKSLALSDQLSVAKLLKDTYLKLYTLKSLSGEHDLSDEYNIQYVLLRDSIDQVERSRILNSQLTRRELVEREAVAEMLRKENDISFRNLTTLELEKNKELLDAELERLEKEKIIEDLNMAKHISDQANTEREEKIQQLTRQKSMQELALSHKELEVSRAQSFRNILITAFVFIVIIAGLLFNRYRNQQKSHDDLDKAYHELSQTHNKLVAAQEQLVHSQKMASLGQLTAGIAHEIQNPLNFVNNFSELSIELIQELKEPDANQSEILEDLAANLQKINTHGKRADKIVKGMLVHSRTGQVDKTPADINKMIDELLELSYHGNRTRDTTFTADIIKNFDPNIPGVNIVMQDLSRVLINLFNNAFYAVGQRVKNEGATFRASVGVSTRLDGDQVIIKIRDNGTGIPEDIRKKIFDPFFTTKPAGEGTGLGLSLSYDIIVKGHHGSLAVNSEPNSYTEFVIGLPLT